MHVDLSFLRSSSLVRGNRGFSADVIDDFLSGAGDTKLELNRPWLAFCLGLSNKAVSSALPRGIPVLTLKAKG